MTGQPFQWPRTPNGCDCGHPVHNGRCPRTFGDVAGFPSTAHPCRCVTWQPTGRTTEQNVNDLLWEHRDQDGTCGVCRDTQDRPRRQPCPIQATIGRRTA